MFDMIPGSKILEGLEYKNIQFFFIKEGICTRINTFFQYLPKPIT